MAIHLALFSPKSPRSSSVSKLSSREPKFFSRVHDVALDILIAGVCVMPILLIDHLPLTDLPAHLARQYVIHDLATSPELQEIYYIRWELVPNLALDVFVLTVSHIVSIECSVRLFCVAAVLMLFFGTMIVNHGWGGKQSKAYRAAPLLVYGGPFQYGFLNYCFGVGLALVFFGVFLRTRRMTTRQQAPFLVLASLLLMLCHLEAFGLFAICVWGCAAADGLAQARCDLRIKLMNLVKSTFVPSVCLAAVFIVFVWLGPVHTDTTSNSVQFSSLHEKIRSVAAITYFAVPTFELTLLFLAVVGLLLGWLARVVRVVKSSIIPLASMLAAWLCLPHIAIGAAFIDYRLPWAISFFFVAALAPGARQKEFSAYLRTWFGVLGLARVAGIAFVWSRWEPTLASIDIALSKLPAGARLMVVEGRPQGGGVFRDPDLEHAAAYVVARRHGFEAGMFASAPGQILHLQPPFLALRDQVDGFSEGPPAALAELSDKYEYLLVLRPNLASVNPDFLITCLEHGQHFALFRVHAIKAPASQTTSLGACLSDP